MRYLGLDYGSRTVGCALTDELGITVQNLETIQRKEEKKLRQTLARVKEIVETYEVGTIVLGLPLDMNDQAGERAERTLYFKALLEKRVDVPIYLQNEQLTTVEAEAVLEEAGIPKKDRKKYIDQIAANIILTEFLRNEDK